MDIIFILIFGLGMITAICLCILVVLVEIQFKASYRKTPLQKLQENIDKKQNSFEIIETATELDTAEELLDVLNVNE